MLVDPGGLPPSGPTQNGRLAFALLEESLLERLGFPCFVFRPPINL